MLSTSVLVGGGAIVAGLVASAVPTRAASPVPTPPPARRNAMTGFRGLLAFGVFMHHAFIWSHYTHGQGWRDSEGFRQFGESRVVLFFLLTSTLFYGRLIDSRGGSLDWLRLYVSRLLRLAPAYWMAMALMIAALGWAALHHVDRAGTAIVLRSWTDILDACAVWLGFSMLGMPAIDGYIDTPLITASVTWTLPYEVTFYMLLPVLALPLPLRARMPATVLALGLGAAVWLGAWGPDPVLCLPFIGGMGVALLVRMPRVVPWLRHRASAAAAMLAMTAVIFLFPTAHALVPMLLLAFSMAVVAADNDLFGVLSWRAPQAIGEWAYSLYLLHGIALYTLFMLVIGPDRAARLTPLAYVGVIAAITPAVLALAWASHRWIESPPMRAVPTVVATLRQLASRARSPDSRPASASRSGAA